LACSAPSFRSIFDRYEPFVTQTLRNMGVPSADRRDLCQEIFVVVHRKLHEYDGGAPFRSWIYGICVRMVTIYRRSRVRREEPCEYLEPAILGDPVAPRQDVYLDTVRACATVEALLAKLDDEKRTIFVLYELEGLTMAEIAAAVGCPLQTAYSRLHAARKAVKVLLLRSRLMLAHWA